MNNITLPDEISKYLLAIADYMIVNNIGILSNMEIFNALNHSNMQVILEPKMINKTVN